MAKILCVDDEPTQLMLLRLALTRQGHDVLEASNGEDGVQMAIQHEPKLIIMDLMMPGMDGATAIQHIKDNEATQNTPILVLSAYVGGSQAQRAIDVGATELISKSLILTDLIEKVNNYAQI